MSYRPDYCSQPTCANCWECSLTNYGRDCQNHSIAQRDAGAARSAAKAAASRANGRKGGRPRNITISDADFAQGALIGLRVILPYNAIGFARIFNARSANRRWFADNAMLIRRYIDDAKLLAEFDAWASRVLDQSEA